MNYHLGKLIRTLAPLSWVFCFITFAWTCAPGQETKAFLHEATAANTAGGSTVIEDTFVNARPDTILIVTPNWNRGGAPIGVYNNSPIAVLYNERIARWSIVNLDMRVPISIGAAFNVKAYRGSTIPTLVHRATAGNISGNSTLIEAILSPVPKALLVTPNWNPGGGPGVSNNHPTGVFFDRIAGSPVGRWHIANQDVASPMPIGAAFNVAVEGLPYAATAANIRGNSMFLENWLVPSDPEALLFVTANPYPTWGPGVYDNHPIGVWYDARAAKWAIFNQDMAAMPVGASFTIKVEAAAITTDKIAFTSNRDGQPQVYVMRGNGTGQRRLSTLATSHGRPIVSPDGTRVALVSDLYGSNQLQAINADGTGIINLALVPAPVSLLLSKPSWSFDSRRVVAVAYGPDSPPASPEALLYYGVNVINADGSGARNLTGRTSDISAASFSPDATRVLYSDFYTGRNLEVYVVNADGSMRTNLTRTVSVNEMDSMWHPDGRSVAFSAFASTNAEIYLMSSDGTGIRQLTRGAPRSSMLPVFSPDGNKLAFVSVSDRRSLPTTSAELYLMNADGTGLVRLATDVVVDNSLTGPSSGLPSFSPDGRKIAFVSNRDGNHEIYCVNIDGSGLTNLTHNPANDDEPSWGR